MCMPSTEQWPLSCVMTRCGKSNTTSLRLCSQIHCNYADSMKMASVSGPSYRMMIPDLIGAAKAIKKSFGDTTAVKTEATKTAVYTARSILRSQHGHSKASALLIAANAAQQSRSDLLEEVHDIGRRQGPTSTQLSSEASTSSGAGSTTEAQTSSTSRTTQTQNSSRPTSISVSRSLTGASSTIGTSLTGPASTATGTLATPAPSCPAASLSNFTDDTGIVYLIKCSTTNSGSAFETVSVTSGGYGQCFSSCSYKTDCVGFSFVGNDSGLCYLRNAQSTQFDSTALVSTYVTAYKLDPDAVASSSASPTEASSGSKKSNAGPIAGGVVGGVAILALLLVVIAFFARRKRRQIEHRRAKESIAPVASQERYYDDFRKTGDGHHRSGSTANDIHSSKGDSEASIVTRTRNGSDSELEAEHIAGPTGKPAVHSPGVRAEGLGLPAAVLRPPQLLDSTPVSYRSSSPKNASRTSIFRENISEMEDTSSTRKLGGNFCDTDSPVLGRGESSQTNSTNQGLSIQADTNNVSSANSIISPPKTPPTARTAPSAVSPGMSTGSRDGRFVISPLRSATSEH
ncbi:hypothetical protein AC579_6594 [Pseudocercospora musae]|uniref:Apple domain-containing protein n=1 Tax=Pseudocercospora musae TaxID=113226 RepID=A0A139IGN3_9PEZI|nr:hypothetical protein AC579_6594 [Pseudocercospora musae]KXT13777.1 hypothetical protein AC579_6594 [Pseudocercospora musae]KXT13779.1 hypothetical protein AC579_6594 [Pseudocercospora musae]